MVRTGVWRRQNDVIHTWWPKCIERYQEKASVAAGATVAGSGQFPKGEFVPRYNNHLYYPKRTATWRLCRTKGAAD
jgi:hypothetical protein